ncbi:hypothetical protein ACM66B_006573 [Microbotryomycetes sp. NB124-2]
MSAPTPASEIIHLVTAFTDDVDSVPPTLTRSLSDLKELDAVLSGSLLAITAKLQRLHEMMSTPPPGSTEANDSPKYSPYERLKLLREVTEDARVLRLGGEDKIRVATSTCETVATHSQNLATIANLLLTFLPPHLLPSLPPPSAPHGFPASVSGPSAIARRQLLEYPPARHAGQGSTTRIAGALGMVRDHWEATRGGAAGNRIGAAAGAGGSRKQRTNAAAAAATGYGSGAANAYDSSTDKAYSGKHPNQYTKKRLQAAAAGAPMGAVHATATNAAAGLYGANGPLMHPAGMSAIDAVKVRKGQSSGAVVVDVAKSNGGGVSGGAQMYPGMASQEEYNAATLGLGRASTKRKMEDGNGARKKSKKGPDGSPDLTPRTLPQPFGAPIKTARRAAAANATPKLDDLGSPPPMPLVGGEEVDPEVEMAEDDDADKTIYCFCQRVSFGEMIGCDGADCEREWFHLSCVGLQTIPKGKWLCEDCRIKAEKGKKRRQQ